MCNFVDKQVEKDINKKTTESEVRAPIREKLMPKEKFDIKTSIFNILAQNNLSIRQSNELLAEVLQEIEDIRPWLHI